MTDPQFPQPSNGAVPPIPPAPGGHPAPPQQPAPYQTPPGAYTAPVGGYTAPVGGYSAPAGGYSPPAGAYQAPPARAPKSAAVGVIAFVLSLVAAVVAPIIAGIAGYEIGFRMPTVMDDVDSAASDLSFLAPVRDQVLIGEIGFWVGTLAGLAAIVLGIMAIAKRQGRVWGIIALIIGVIGPVMFFVVLVVTLTAGAGSGAITYYGS